MAETYQPALERQPNTSPAAESQGRRAQVSLLEGLGQALANGDSLAQFAEKHGVPESTLRYWISRAQACGAPQAFVNFVETPDGLDVLHRIVLAATFVLTQLGGGGVRSVCAFLQLSGLWRVVAAGYGTQQQAVKAMEESINAFGARQRQEMAAAMAPREITIARDETFHENPCLVAIEPVSNFILVEEYAQDRTAETWSHVMQRGISGMPVNEIQATSDGGSALLKMARDNGAHYSPDLFHPQQDISRATSLALRSKVTAAEQDATKAAMDVEALLDEVESYEVQPRGPGRPRDYETKLKEAELRLTKTDDAVDVAKGRREEVREAARAFSRAYHPFDLKTGLRRDASKVKRDIDNQMNRIEQVATAADIKGRCHALLQKARRVVPQMVATIAFVHSMIRDKVEALDLTPGVEEAVLGQLIPARYLEEVLPKTPTAEARSEIRVPLGALKAAADQPNSCLAGLSAEDRTHLDRVALECAQLFQRSSSNVEGRNGVLALRHHSAHRLNPRKLRALTVIHNFWTSRADGTTPAERFFGNKHPDLFEFLLAATPPPKRPAARRVAIN